MTKPKLYCSQCRNSLYERDNITGVVFLHCFPFRRHLPTNAHYAPGCFFFQPEGPIAEKAFRDINKPPTNHQTTHQTTPKTNSLKKR